MASEIADSAVRRKLCRPLGRNRGAACRSRWRHGSATTNLCCAYDLLTRQASVFGIPKASTAAHVRDNAAGASLALEAADIALLGRRVSAPAKRAS